jgi:ligand-binding sensor domain-containing protein
MVSKSNKIDFLLNNIHLQKRILRHVLVNLIVAVFIPILSFSQKNILNIRSEYYSIHNGLNSSEIFGIHESDDGFIWLATNNGLVRYDGHTFKTFNFNVDDSTTISSNYIKRSCLDRHGQIWLASTDFLDVFDTKTLLTKRLKNKENIVNGRYSVQNFHYDKARDEMWIPTKKGLYFNKGKNINIVRKSLPQDIDKKYIFNDILIDGNIVWLSGAYGLYKWNKVTNAIKTFHHTKSKPPTDGDGFLNLFKDNNGIIWIGNWVWGLTSFDPKTEHMNNYIYRSSDVQNAVYFTKNFDANSFEHLLLVGTMQGLKIFDKIQKKFISNDQVNLNIKDQLKNFSVLQSHKSGTWIGTSKGLYRLDLNSRFIKSIPLGFKGKSALDDFEDIYFEPYKKAKDSIIWFLGSYDKLFKYDLINKKELPLPSVLYPFGQASRGLGTLYLDMHKTLWLTSVKDLLIGFDIEKNILIKPNFICNNPMSIDIAEDSNGDLWFGTINGLFYYQRSNNTFYRNEEVESVLTSTRFSKRVLRIEIDKNDNIWLASGWQEGNVGLVFYNPKKHIVKCYNLEDNKALLSLTQIESIKNVGNEIFISGINGLVRCEINERGLLNLKIVSNIYSWKSHDLRKTQLIGKDQLWFQTKHGLLNYSIKNDQVMEFNHINSNVGVDIRDCSYSIQSDRIYMPRLNQLDYFEVDSIKKFRPASVKLVDASIANYALARLPQNGTHLNLESHQNSLQFEFSNFSFNNSIENGYFYKINNDQDWRKMNGNRLNFDGLGKGHYVLKVISTNCFGTLNEIPFLLQITILPPFYQTWWFFSLCILSILLIFYYLYRLKINELNRLQQVRLTIARDLHDDMGSNLSQIKMLSEFEILTNPDQPVYHLIVQKMTEVMTNMSEIIWNANPKNDKVEDVLNRILDYAISTLEPLGISVKFNFESLIDNLTMNIEAKRHFYLIFKEAINNIGKYAKATSVAIEAKTSDYRICISIKDNGIGFDPWLIKHGNGLVNMKERAKQLKGDLKIDTNENGTSITLTI